MRRTRFGILITVALIAQVLVMPASASTTTDAEACFVNAINTERTSRGLAPMLVDPDPLGYARQHTSAMISAGSLFHSTSAQLAAVLPKAMTNWGENVGYASTCERLHRAFMESPGHKANILDPDFNRMTVGVAFSSGRLWATEIFYAYPGLPPFWDDDGSPHESDIIKLAAAGITGGCGGGRYCPNASLTRAQMAVFLSRALGMPGSGTDYFTDDNGHQFEAEINAIAHAGVTSGCDLGSFCPDVSLTRGQMASFIKRAFNLAATSADYFSDDSGSVYEADINALAAAGITSGCGAGRFCPHGALTRAEMATFLVRALGW
jgi:hypothetical protein